MKTCFKCRLEKPKSEFNKHGSSKDGLHSYCRECLTIYQKEHYTKNKEKYRENHRVYNQNNAESISRTQREYAANNKEKLKEYNKKWRKTAAGKLYIKNMLEQKNERRATIKSFLDWVKSSGCLRCKYNDCLSALDFHHLIKKENEGHSLYRATTSTWGNERIINELKKCILLCSNCHRKEHCSKK